MNSVAKILLASLILFVGMIAAANAQGGNPLRHNAIANPLVASNQTQPNSTKQNQPLQARQLPTQPQRDLQRRPNDMSREVFDAIYTPKRDVNPPVQESHRIPTTKTNQQNIHQASSNHVVDHDVLPAGYSPGPPETQHNMRPVADMLTQLQSQTNQQQTQNQPLDQLNRLGASDLADSEPALSKSQSEQQGQVGFQQLIQNIAWSTCLVLAIGVGFIFAAKHWMQHKTPTRKKAESPIKIASTLRLSPKSNLFLVEAGEQRLIVASDQNGIKSIVALGGTQGEGESFAATLNSLSAATSTEDRDSVLFSQDSIGDSKTVEDSPSSPDVYSLGSVGKSNTSSVANTDNDSAEQIRLQMEKALKEHGLKDLFLESFRSNALPSSS